MNHIKLWEELTGDELQSLEDYADYIFSTLGVDVVFSNHFKERINDARNGVPISYEEMTDFFKRAYQEAGRQIADLPIGVSAVLKDIFSKINVPFVIKDDPRHREHDLVLKTVMRKSNFKTPDTQIEI